MPPKTIAFKSCALSQSARSILSVPWLICIFGLIDPLLPSISRSTPCEGFNGVIQVGVITSSDLPEISGLVASRSQPGVFWAHNDSDNTPEVYAFDRDGEVLASVLLSNATNCDWEDIAIGPGPDPANDYLYIGDIGGNAPCAPRRAGPGGIVIYRLPEPIIDSSTTPVSFTVQPEILRFRYPNSQPLEAETLLVDPWSGDISLVTRTRFARNTLPTRLYSVPSPQNATTEIVPLTFVGDVSVSMDATGGDFSPLGHEVIIREPSTAYLWNRSPMQTLGEALSQPPCIIPTASTECKGEAITFDPFGHGFFTTSERLCGLVLVPTAPHNYYIQNYYFQICPRPGDLNCDREVNAKDLLILTKDWKEIVE